MPPSLSAMGLTREIFLECPSNFTVQQDTVVTNLLIQSLEKLRIKERLPASHSCHWIKKLLPPSLGTIKTEAKIRHVISQLSKRISKIVKQKDSEPQLQKLLSEPAFIDHNGSTDAVIPGKKEKWCYGACVSNASLRKEISVLKDKLKRAEEENSYLGEHIKYLMEEQTRLNILAEGRKSSASEIQNLRSQKKDLLTQIENFKLTKVYKNNQALKKEIISLKEERASLQEELSGTSTSLTTNCVERENRLESLKLKVKSEQKQKDKYQKLLRNEQETSFALSKLVNEEEEEKSITLKNEKRNCFSDNVRLAYMALQGEANVAASNCSKVVQIVSRHLLNKVFTAEELPSKSSALNFVAEAHLLAKQQISDNILSSKHFTYGCDGTSRQKQHFIEQHIILDSGVMMSLGFKEVASDDAETLLEVCIKAFTELSQVSFIEDNDRDQEKVLKEIIRKMKGLMSDRASVMKLFDSKMAAYKDELLGGEDSSLFFLFCNAHFLIGLASATEEAVKIIEKDLKDAGNQLGRDASSAFSHFNKSCETATLRLIRTASDVLGPRGDEKSGCRQEWLAYCSSIKQKSYFTSYRSNRFNNIFENASAVLFHESDIKKFLMDYVSHSNLKLHSVLEDLEDSNIKCVIAAMALFHSFFTSPYWKLMNSKVSYGQFPQYVWQMENVLETWCMEVNTFEEIQPVFCDFHKMEDYLDVGRIVSSYGDTVAIKNLY